MKIERENKNRAIFVGWEKNKKEANNEELETRNVYNSNEKKKNKYTRQKKNMQDWIQHPVWVGGEREKKNYNDLGRTTTRYHGNCCSF